jgi:pyruvate formate lyase activating enzyme
MKIGGLQKISLIDYPGRISAILFTQGCNFRCPYCHNPELVDPVRYSPTLSENEVIAFLEKRRGKLDAVTVTGGEPTLQPDIDRLLKAIKRMGYLIKIDTNGSNPEVLERLIRGRLLDYVAMDVKGPLRKYARIARVKVDTAKIRKSIGLVTASGIEHEFRTTVVRSQLDNDDLIATAKLLKRAQLYVLQTFVPAKTLCPEFLAELPCTSDDFSAVQKYFAGRHPLIVLR